MSDNDFEELTQRIRTEFGGDTWESMDEIVEEYFGELTRELHNRGYSTWVEPGTGFKFEVHLTMAAGLKGLAEKVEYH